MSDPALSTRPLPEGVTATPVWGAWKREDGSPTHPLLIAYDTPLKLWSPR